MDIINILNMYPEYEEYMNKRQLNMYTVKQLNKLLMVLREQITRDSISLSTPQLKIAQLENLQNSLENLMFIIQEKKDKIGRLVIQREKAFMEGDRDKALMKESKIRTLRTDITSINASIADTKKAKKKIQRDFRIQEYETLD